MRYEIEIVESKNKKTYNAYKKRPSGEEMGYIYDLSSVEEAEQALRARWKHKGVIKVIQNDVVLNNLEGA
jgi:hypothetical protein